MSPTGPGDVNGAGTTRNAAIETSVSTGTFTTTPASNLVWPGGAYGIFQPVYIADTITIGGRYTFTLSTNGLWTWTGQESYYNYLNSDTDGPGPKMDDAVTETFTAFYTDDNGTTYSHLVIVDIRGTTDVCFTRGARISTPTGQRLVEDLREGDLVITRDNGVRPIRWIGSTVARTVGGEPLKRRAPIRIKAHALGRNLPERDVLLSPLHRVLVAGPEARLLMDNEEVLVPAKFLVNGSTIMQADDLEEVEYFHILFDTHEVIYADGLPSESFHPGEVGLDNMEIEIREEILTLFPELLNDMNAYGPAARYSARQFEGEALARELFGPLPPPQVSRPIQQQRA